MTKYWGKQISHTRVSPKWVKSRRRREKKDSTMVITMASYSLQMPPRVAHTKPPGPKVNTPGTRGGQVSRDRTLAVKRRKNDRKERKREKKKNKLGLSCAKLKTSSDKFC